MYNYDFIINGMFFKKGILSKNIECIENCFIKNKVLKKLYVNVWVNISSRRLNTYWTQFILNRANVLFHPMKAMWSRLCYFYFKSKEKLSEIHKFEHQSEWMDIELSGQDTAWDTHIPYRVPLAQVQALLIPISC